MTKDEWKKRKTVAASSAALLNLVLPAYMELPAEQRHKRLTAFLIGTINAYRDAKDGLFDVPEPSKNRGES